MTGDKLVVGMEKNEDRHFLQNLRDVIKGQMWLKLTTTYKFFFFFLHLPFVQYNKVVGGDKVNTEFYGEIHVIG